MEKYIRSLPFPQYPACCKEFLPPPDVGRCWLMSGVADG